MWTYYYKGRVLAHEEATIYGVHTRMKQLGADFAQSDEGDTTRGQPPCTLHSI